MEVIYNEQIVCFDVDDTLVLYDPDYSDPNVDIVYFTNPYDGSLIGLTPHHQHLDLMKKYKGRGYYVVVWSAGGVKWAESVVKTLGIEQYVDLVTTKPSKYVDDLPCGEWMGNRVFIGRNKRDEED